MPARAERRIAEAGRERCRLDCVSSNPRLREYYEAAADGSTYGVTLLEKDLRERGPSDA